MFVDGEGDDDGGRAARDHQRALPVWKLVDVSAWDKERACSVAIRLTRCGC